MQGFDWIYFDFVIVPTGWTVFEKLLPVNCFDCNCECDDIIHDW